MNDGSKMSTQEILHALKSVIEEGDDMQAAKAAKRLEMMELLRTERAIDRYAITPHFRQLDEQLELLTDAWSSAEDRYIDNALSIIINARFEHNQSKQR